jgi:hypothetical protein
MRLKFKDREFEITWMEIIVIVVIIYLLITGDFNELGNIIGPLK